jgi:type IV secretion system protein VirD4
MTAAPDPTPPTNPCPTLNQPGCDAWSGWDLLALVPGPVWVALLAGAVIGYAIYIQPWVTTVRDRWRHSINIRAGLIIAGVAVVWWLATHGYAVPVVVAAAGLALAVWVHRGRSGSIVGRWGARSRRTSGVATITEILRRGSWWSLRSTMAVIRPVRCGGLTWRQRWRVRSRELGVALGRVGFLRVWSGFRDVVLVFGGPGTGKTAFLGAGPILDFPGALIVTSTRTDLYMITRRLRRLLGPVTVFNAAGLGDVESSVAFDPLTGCTDPVAAAERAGDMLDAVAGGGPEAKRWAEQAKRLLTPLLHAAALGGLPIDVVQTWLSDIPGSHLAIDYHLEQSPEPAFRAMMRLYQGMNPNTLTSITASTLPALSWLSNPAARKAAAHEYGFDVEEFLRSRGTVYLLGAEEANTAPLVCAFTGYVAREFRRLAALQPTGVLDPPGGLRLDEAALISPVPLASWTADMGGRGVSIIVAFQSLAQVRAKWGDNDASVTLNNAGGIMLFGGTRDRSDLAFWSDLFGDRDERVERLDANGHVTGRDYRKVPVFPPTTLALLPPGRAVVIRKGMSPVVVRPPRSWKRWDVQTPRWVRALRAVTNYCYRVDVACCRRAVRLDRYCYRTAVRLDRWLLTRAQVACATGHFTERGADAHLLRHIALRESVAAVPVPPPVAPTQEATRV